MDDDIYPAADPGFAVEAFAELRAEISLLRRAVERLTDERTSQPDYAPSLEAIGRGLEDVQLWARRISDMPALKLTPEAYARQLVQAAAQAREADRQLLGSATTSINAITQRFETLIVSARSAAEQARALKQNRIAFSVAGMALFAILPGAVARALPVSWAVPERIAARMLGSDMWHAGEQMMVKSDPERWRRIVDRQHDRASSHAVDPDTVVRPTR